MYFEVPSFSSYSLSTLIQMLAGQPAPRFSWLISDVKRRACLLRGAQLDEGVEGSMSHSGNLFVRFWNAPRLEFGKNYTHCGMQILLFWVDIGLDGR